MTFLAPLARCEYLRDHTRRIRYELKPDLHADEFMARLREGWRRFGPFLFRPECPSCRMCQSLRVPVGAFRPTESQRRAWKRNRQDVAVRIGQPSVSDEKQQLFAKFHRHGHETKGWPLDAEQGIRVFTLNPFRTEEWSYFVGERLVGVGYVDALSQGLSAIYFYWDPAEARRSLGTFNILTMIEAARSRQLPHVYLGYHVRGCRSLEYKARFRPNEVLGDDGVWTSFIL